MNKIEEEYMLRSRLFCCDLNGFKAGNCLMAECCGPFNR